MSKVVHFCRGCVHCRCDFDYSKHLFCSLPGDPGYISRSCTAEELDCQSWEERDEVIPLEPAPRPPSRKEQLRELREQLAAAKQENARLLEALRPFAESGAEVLLRECEYGIEFDVDMRPADICKFNCGDLKYARQAYSALSNHDTEEDQR